MSKKIKTVTEEKANEILKTAQQKKQKKESKLENKKNKKRKPIALAVIVLLIVVASVSAYVYTSTSIVKSNIIELESGSPVPTVKDYFSKLRKNSKESEYKITYTNTKKGIKEKNKLETATVYRDSKGSDVSEETATTLDSKSKEATKKVVAKNSEDKPLYLKKGYKKLDVVVNTYTYKVKIKDTVTDKSFNTTLKIVDKTSPKITGKNIEITEGDEIPSAKDFIESYYDNSYIPRDDNSVYFVKKVEVKEDTTEKKEVSSDSDKADAKSDSKTKAKDSKKSSKSSKKSTKTTASIKKATEKTLTATTSKKGKVTVKKATKKASSEKVEAKKTEPKYIYEKTELTDEQKAVGTHEDILVVSKDSSGNVSEPISVTLKINQKPEPEPEAETNNGGSESSYSGGGSRNYSGSSNRGNSGGNSGGSSSSSAGGCGSQGYTVSTANAYATWPCGTRSASQVYQEALRVFNSLPDIHTCDAKYKDVGGCGDYTGSQTIYDIATGQEVGIIMPFHIGITDGTGGWNMTPVGEGYLKPWGVQYIWKNF